MLVGDLNYYHQNKRYFSDWADYCDKGNVGYYLGARFVHYLLESYKFDDLINFDIDIVCELFKKF